MFVPDHREARDDDEAFVLDIARRLGIAFSALPAALVFAPVRERSDGMLLRLERYLPERMLDDDVDRGDAVTRLFGVIADAARMVAYVNAPVDLRLRVFDEELVRFYRSAFSFDEPPTDPPKRARMSLPSPACSQCFSRQPGWRSAAAKRAS